MNRKFGLLTRMREPHYSEICCLDHLLKAMAELAFLHNCFSYSQHTFSWIFDADLSLTSTPRLILLTVCEHNFTPLLSYRHTHFAVIVSKCNDGSSKFWNPWSECLEAVCHGQRSVKQSAFALRLFYNNHLYTDRQGEGTVSRCKRKNITSCTTNNGGT